MFLLCSERPGARQEEDEGEFLTSVPVIFCGAAESKAGAIELWRHDPFQGSEMALADACHGSATDAFGHVARHTRFRKGHGLPGTVWETGLPTFMEDLGNGSGFKRPATAGLAGIDRGFAMPCPAPGETTHVMAFLSVLDAPIVRRFESWEPDASRQRLVRAAGFCEVDGVLTASPDQVRPEPPAVGA